ncbi:MAG: hypothetical protein M3Q10_08995 [Chloroflexota bacterium]|nr:hypothetical protein [Chloroflexota bacterium]
MARRHDLLEGLTERRARLLRIVEQREAWYRENREHVPGGDSGYLAETYKVVGTGAFATVQPEHAVDTGLVKSLNETEKQGAVLAGIWTEKQDIALDAEIGVHRGPATVVRIRDQRPSPYSPNKGGRYPPGKFVKDEQGIWRDAETGEPYDDSIEAQYRDVTPAAINDEAAVEWLREQRNAGRLSESEFQAEIRRLRQEKQR